MSGGRTDVRDHLGARFDTGPLPACRSGECPTHVVAIVGSAGALHPLKTIINALPLALDAAVLVVIHYPSHFESALPQVLARTAMIPVARARDGEHMSAGHVYVAPPGRHHLVVDGPTLRLRPGRPVHRHMPAADPLLTSVASCYGKAAIGVVLSGADANGAAGLRDVKSAGGTALVQLPSEARFAQMPQSVLKLTSVDLCASAQALAERIVQLCTSDKCPAYC